MGTKVKLKGFIAFFAQTICTSVALESKNSAIAAAAETIGAVVSEAVGSIDISEKKETPAQLFVDIFEKILRESINETFETDGRDEKIIAELKEIQLSACQIMNEENKKALNAAIYEILDKNGLYTDNISVGTIDNFIETINSKMHKEVLDNELLLAFDTYVTVKDTNTAVNETSADIKDIKADVKDIKADINNMKAGFDDLKKSADKDASIVDTSLQPEPVSEFVNAVRENKKYYINKWNDRLFLHRGDGRKELTLQNTFIFPDYDDINLKTNEAIIKHDLKEQLNEFIKNRGSGNLLITGTPGMGKSSIASYIANQYSDDSIIILKYKDTDDFLSSDSGIHVDKILLKAICQMLGCEKKELSGKTLILDGFDETERNADNQKLLNRFLNDVKDISEFKVIVTSRENYINTYKVKFRKHFSLNPFSDEKIREYYSLIMDNTLSADIKIENIDVLGIPVILYMALSVDTIDITSSASRSELYEKIFAVEGGIFDRFEDNYNEAYGEGKHPIMDIKEKFVCLLRELAFYMFENGVEPVAKQKYIELSKRIIDVNDKRFFSDDDKEILDGTILDFPIKNLYENSSGIEFVHRSIYEYFTAEYMYQEIKKGLEDNNKEHLAGVLGKLFKKNLLSDEIKEYLYYKISVGISTVSSQFFADTFDLMLEKGMTYYTKECYENVIRCEGRVFVNMLELLHVWKYDENNRLVLKSKQMIKEYIECSEYTGTHLNLNGVDLSKIVLSGVHLNGADLNGADLRETELYGTHLRGAHLRFADLSGAELGGAELKFADLSEAKLNCANLSRADLGEANLDKADLFEAELGRADLGDADLSGANLSGAKLNGADLIFTDLTGADLNEIYLYEAILDSDNIKVIEELYEDLKNENIKIYIKAAHKIFSYETYKELSQKGIC